MVAQGWGCWGGNRERLTAVGTGSVCEDENVLKVILVMVVQVCEYPNNH